MASAIGDAFALGPAPDSGAPRPAIGALLVHGFTGTPYEMRFLGERLGAAGITTIGMRLPGHGTTIAELAQTSLADWQHAVGRELDALSARCAHTFLIGQSLGGLLSLETASRRPSLAGVVSLAAPLWLPPIVERLITWAMRGWLDWLPPLPKLGGSDVRDDHVRRVNPGYRALPPQAVRPLVAAMRAADAALSSVGVPVLALHGADDHTAPSGALARIAALVPHARTQLFARSYHLLASDVERDAVADAVLAFIRDICTNRDQGATACAT